MQFINGTLTSVRLCLAWLDLVSREIFGEHELNHHESCASGFIVLDVIAQDMPNVAFKKLLYMFYIIWLLDNVAN